MGCGLTFDMSGSRRRYRPGRSAQTCPAVGCPLDEAVRRLVGACRIPDPTTAGDFLRRFKSAQDVEQLFGVIDEVEEAVWSKLPGKVRRRRKKHELALVDLDGHVKPLMEYRNKEPISATMGVGRISRWWFRLAAAASALR